MDHVRSRDAVDRKAEMTEAAAAHGELAIEVVCRCCGGERLQRAQRIVQHHPAQRLQITSMQNGTARRAVRVIADRPLDGHDFTFCAVTWTNSGTERRQCWLPRKSMPVVYLPFSCGEMAER